MTDLTLDALAALAAIAADAAGGQTPIVEINTTRKVVGETHSPDGRGTRDEVVTVNEMTVAVPNGGAGPFPRFHRDITVLGTGIFSGELSTWYVVKACLPQGVDQTRREAKVCEFEIEAVPPSRGCRDGEPACIGEIWAVVDNNQGAYFERRRPPLPGYPWSYPPSRRWVAEDGTLVSTETGRSLGMKIDREHALSVLRSLI